MPILRACIDARWCRSESSVSIIDDQQRADAAVVSESSKVVVIIVWKKQQGSRDLPRVLAFGAAAGGWCSVSKALPTYFASRLNGAACASGSAQVGMRSCKIVES